MKYIILLLIGVALVTTVLPDKRDSTSNLDKTESTTSSIVSPEVKAEEVKEPVKDTPKKSTPPPVDVVKENPNKCDTNTEWIYPDGSCHKKQTESIASSTTAPTASSSGGCELVRNYTNWNVDVAYAVCMAESGGNTNAANYNDNHGSCIGSFGLMQLACFWIPNPTDPNANIAKANEIWSRSGWQPWGAYTSGKYLKYL
jgi:hypothetical protein